MFWISDAKNKPVEGTMFDTLELALKIYKAYAREGGQGLKSPAKNDKKKTDKVKPAQSESQVDNNVIQRRKRASQRCGCEAKLRIKRMDENKWRVYKFLEKHNYRLVCKEDYMYLKVARKLSFPQQQLLYQLSIANLGPTRSWKVLKEMYRGFENVCVTDVECRNYKLDFTIFIGNRDAQMVVEKLYNMVLVPFTDIDNHNRCILFGAALLASENTKKYRWLLKRFKKIFGSALKVAVTDQDPAMKNAIEEIFPDSTHRLCMWHIMKKLSGKVGPDLCNNMNFKKCLCDIVWTDKMDLNVFESEWRSIMQDFALNDHKWLNKMYLMRSKWIPAYFRHEPMSGLMRTTSRSESENHFLGQLTNPDLTLVEFLSHYDTAIDSQRFKYGKNTHDSNYMTPDFKTHLDIEKQAAEFYTQTLFYDVQDEIWCSLMHCHSLNVIESENFSTFVIHDIEADYKIYNVHVQVKYEVKYVPSECSVQCSCLRRWSKNAMLMKSVNKSHDVASGSKSESVDCVLREIYNNVEQSVTHLVGDLEKLHLYKDAQTTLMEKAKTAIPNPPKMNTNIVYASTLGVTEPEEVTILPPNDINNKGNRIRTRLKSKSEIAMKLSDRPKRLCRSCLKYTSLDSRNYPIKKGLQDDDVADVVQDEGGDMDMYLSD
ncbi:FAR1 DNA binding domain, zinc finger, SWIM-type, MULE transposase domain containing protein [Tanacetum coccineum]